MVRCLNIRGDIHWPFLLPGLLCLCFGIFVNCRWDCKSGLFSRVSLFCGNNINIITNEKPAFNDSRNGFELLFRFRSVSDRLSQQQAAMLFQKLPTDESPAPHD